MLLRGIMPNDLMFLYENFSVSLQLKIKSMSRRNCQSIQALPLLKKYQAPFARVSCLEDPSTRNSEYGKAPPASLQTTAYAEPLKVHVSDPKSWKLEKFHEAIDKSQVKESSKGFKRLLKFGKKSHTTSERSNYTPSLPCGSSNQSKSAKYN